MTEMAGRPALRVVAGRPTAQELAAVVVVLSARSAAPAGPAVAAPSASSQWAARSRLLREPVAAAPGGWRASGLPR